MLGGADNPNGELPSYITGANIFSYISFFSGLLWYFLIVIHRLTSSCKRPF